MRFQKKIRIIFSLCTVFVFLAAGVFAQESGDNKSFLKGIIIDSVGPELSNKNKTNQSVERIRNAGFNSVFPQVREMGEVYYTSVLEPRSARIDSAYSDPLLQVITQAHGSGMEEGMQVVPMLSIFPASSGQISAIPPDGNIMERKPEWITVNYEGERMDHNMIYHLDPGIEGVRNYITAMVLEVVKNYDVDGILLHDFRYPDDGLNWGYNAQALASYYYETGLSEKPLPHDPRWCDWRRKCLTNLMEQIYNNVKKVNPKVKVYIGGLAWGEPPASEEDFKNTPAYSLVFQDWLGWMNKGIVDGVVVYNYKQYPQQKEEFEGWLDFLMTRSEGTYVSAVGGFFNFNDSILNQIRAIRDRKLKGAVIFSYRVPTQDDADLLFKTLPTSVFSPTMLKIRRSGITFTPEPPEQMSTEEEIPTSPTAMTDLSSTETAAMATPSPTPAKIIIPSLPGLPSLPNLSELVTPTPVVTPVEPTPTSPPSREIPDMQEEDAEKESSVRSTPPKKPMPDEAEPTPKLPVPEWDTIYLKNGSTLKGKVLEEVEGKATIETSKGFVMTIPIDKIEKVVKYR